MMKMPVLLLILASCQQAFSQTSRYDRVPSQPILHQYVPVIAVAPVVATSTPASSTIDQRIQQAKDYNAASMHSTLSVGWHTGTVTSPGYICESTQLYISGEGIITRMKTSSGEVEVPGGTKVVDGKGMFIGPEPKADGTVDTRYFTVYFL